jgi:hypothetical protein
VRFVTVIVMPRRRNEQRQQRNVEQLDAIAEGQQQRTVLEDTRGIYIAKCRVMTHEQRVSFRA